MIPVSLGTKEFMDFYVDSLTDDLNCFSLRKKKKTKKNSTIEIWKLSVWKLLL